MHILSSAAFMYKESGTHASNQSCDKLVKTLINKYFLNLRCIVLIYNVNDVMEGNSLLQNSRDSVIPIIRIDINATSYSENNTPNRFSKLSRAYCKIFIIVANNVLSYFYSSLVANSNATKFRKYLLLQCQTRKYSNPPNLSNTILKLLYPNIVVIKPMKKGSHFGVRMEILTYLVENNLRTGRLKLVDEWNGNQFERNCDVYKDTFCNLQGIVVKIGILEYPPFGFSVSKQSHDGIEVRAIKEVSRKYNFSLEVHVEHEGFGAIYSNGTATGLRGKVLYGNVDIGVTGFYVNKVNYEYFTITTSYFQSGITFLMQKPKMLSFLWHVYLPLNKIVWGGVVTFSLFGALCLHSFACVEHNLFPHKTKSVYYDFTYAWINVVRFLVRMGTKRPFHASVHHIVIWILITSMLIGTVYDSNLVSFLTVPFYSTPIDTLEQFEKSGLKWGAKDAGWVQFFQQSESTLLQNIKDRFIRFNDFEEFNNKLERGEVSILAERYPSGEYSNTEFLTDNALRTLHIMRDDVLKFHVTTILKPGSPLVNKLNHVLMWLRDSGIIDHWELDISIRFGSKRILTSHSYKDESQKNYCQLRMDNLDGVFVSLLIGHGVSVIVFLTEKLVQYINLTSSTLFK